MIDLGARFAENSTLRRKRRGIRAVGPQSATPRRRFPGIGDRRNILNDLLRVRKVVGDLYEFPAVSLTINDLRDSTAVTCTMPRLAISGVQLTSGAGRALSPAPEPGLQSGLKRIVGNEPRIPRIATHTPLCTAHIGRVSAAGCPVARCGRAGFRRVRPATIRQAAAACLSQFR